MSDNTIKAQSAIESSGNPENPSEAVNPEAGMKKPEVMPKGKKKKYKVKKDMHMTTETSVMISEGDFVMGMTKEGIIHGMVEHIMIEGGVLGTPGSEYALESMPPENPAMSVRIYEEEDGGWEPTAYSIGMMYKDAEVIEMSDHSMEEEDMYSEMQMAMYDSSIGKTHSCKDESSVSKAYEGCGCPTCKELDVNCENCPVCQAEAMKSYHSDDEEMDKWDNMQKACWVGYTQQGMKEKDGRMVPNCVPVGKADDAEKAEKPNYGNLIKPRQSGSRPSNPKLYARVVQAAKDKFDVYPSAVANSWVVQEYKRRGGTYKADETSTTKSIWDGAFDPEGFIK
jgi:hypothetical protein